MIAHQEEYSYITLTCDFDTHIRLDTLEPQEAVKVYNSNLVPTIVLQDDQIVVFELDKQHIKITHKIKGDVRQAQSIYLHLAKGKLGLVGGYERGRINEYADTHYYLSLEDNKREERAQIVEGRAFASTTTYSANLSVMVGGINGEGINKKSQTLIYDWMRNLWKVGPFLVRERMHTAVCRCGEYIYALGGQWSNFDLEKPQEFFIHDLPMERWQYGGKVEKFQIFSFNEGSVPQIDRKNASIAPLNNKEIILFGGFRFSEETKDGAMVINTQTKEVTNYHDPKSDLFFYYEQMWVPLGGATFCVAKAFDYEIDATEFAIFKLESENSNEIQAEIFRQAKEDKKEPKKDDQEEEEDAPGEQE